VDTKTFAIIVILTTIISYLIIRKFFKIAPRYLVYGSLGIFMGLVMGVLFTWPLSKIFGQYGVIVAPYILGIILMVSIEAFVIEGKNILVYFARKYK